MSTAAVTFHAEGELEQQQLRVTTLYPVASGYDFCNDPPVLAGQALGSRCNLETAISDALSEGALYPQRAADGHLRSLGWDSGLRGILRGQPSQLKITVSPDTCYVIPELAPVAQRGGSVTWLDTLWPIYRTIDGKVGRTDVDHPRDLSLAIIHQEDPLFADLAQGVQKDLANLMAVDCYRGSQFAEGQTERTRILEKIFHEYRAVLFLGHYANPTEHVESGWQLSDRDVLTMTEMANVLGVALDSTHSYRFRRSGLRPSAPEVIFAGCCRGAASDPKKLATQKSFFYPQIFLNGGARFFIGSWMDIVWSDRLRDQELARVQQLPSEFFKLWAQKPRDAVEHLYQAKKACGFHLVTSLYQIYTSAVEMAEAEPAEPQGAIASGIVAGDRLGNLALVCAMWRDVYAQTFWATNPQGAGCMVQVLADEWQGQRELVADAIAAVEHLRNAKLGKDHLVPSRAEVMLWLPAQRSVLVIVYDNVEGQPENWQLLEGLQTKPHESGHVRQVLRQGASISFALAGLHHSNIAHGNLGMSNVVAFVRGNEMGILLKDAWVHQLRMGRCLKARYDAPDRQPGDPSEDFTRDCYGLGVVLYELATGQAPFEADEPRDRGLKRSVREVLELKGADPTEVPEGLDLIIRDCLTPVAQWRASADWVARRLALAEATGDSDFTGELHLMIQAGHRLFAIDADDVDELEASLVSLVSRPRAVTLAFRGGQQKPMRYLLLVAAEELGLVDRTPGREEQTLTPWITMTLCHQIMCSEASTRGETQPAVLSSNDVGLINARRILPKIAKLCEECGPGIQPIVLMRGYDWWEYGSEAYRLISSLQSAGRGAPVLITADHVCRIGYDASRWFVRMAFPRPSGSVLFERILAMRPDIRTETAIDLATKLPPCSWRDAADAMRVCEARYKQIDGRAVQFMEENRIRVFRSLDCATYTPTSRLLDPHHFGMPPHLQATVDKWIGHSRASVSSASTPAAPKRLLVTGAPGWGKTAFVEVLAKLSERPLVRLDAAACLHGRVGESEMTIRAALDRIHSLRRVVVLLDNVDRLFVETGANDAAAISATLGRVASSILHWLDNVPLGITIVLAATHPEKLTVSWRRRIDLELSLNPIGTTDVFYRAEVFSSLFRRFGLGELVESDGRLMTELASETNPSLRPVKSVLSPLARSAFATGLASDRVVLHSPADIQWWIQENLLLNSSRRPGPEQREFWIDAIG